MLYTLKEDVPALGKERFFNGMSPEVVERLNAFAYHRRYEPRQIIHFPDDPCDYVYWVREGRVKITRISVTGREITFRHLFEGDMFGEECLIQSLRRNNYAEAVTPTLLTLVRSEDFSRLLQEEPELCHRVACQLCKRTMDTETVLAEFVFVDVRTRVASRLWHLFQHENLQSNEALVVTHQDIANLAGTARETATVALHSLREEGIISLSNSQIHVLRPDELKRLAELR
jgi:CRP/FNR family transcriptional regulator, cyclic AMP receptor protein